MDKSGAGSFIYAKASGILGKSFVGPRASVLFEQKNLSELWNLLFKTPVPLVPETLLAEQIENKAFEQFLNQYTNFISQYSEPDGVLLNQFEIFEASNLKAIGAALCSGDTKLPKLTDIGRFATLRPENWPDIQKITSRSEFAWYNKVPSIHEQMELEYKIDLQVVQNLWKSLESLSGETYDALRKLYIQEYGIKNVVWALRLKIHYNMDNDQIKQRLIHVTNSATGMDPIAAPALKILENPIDEYDVWEKWSQKDLLNPHTPGEVWNVDPGWIEKMNRVKINNMALHMFHQYPMTSASLVGWYNIKNYELSCIRTAVESLRLNINPNEAMNAVGVQTQGV